MTIPRPVRSRDIEWRIYAKLDGVDWTNISRDVLDQGVTASRGLPGGGPGDLVAQAGKLTFWLNNSHANEAGLLGRYSPSHISARQGFRVGTPVRLDIAYQGDWKTQWIGRISDIEPQHGRLGSRAVMVVASDWMEEAALHRLKSLPTLADVRAGDVIEALLDAIPSTPQSGSNLDTGADVYPLALDNVRDGKTTAMTELSRLMRSGFDHVFVTREGEVRFLARASRFDSTQNLFTLDGTFQDVRVTRSRKSILNRVEVTVHPRDVSDDLAVLASLEDKPFLVPGEPQTFRLEYRDPSNPAERLGAIDVQTPLVAGQDYTASIQQAVASGTPDTPATLRPNGDGFYTGAGSAADLADENDSTGIAFNGGFIKRSVTLGDVTAASNAAVSSVRVKVRINYTAGPGNIDGSGYGGFFVFYPLLRLNGIEAPMIRSGTTATLYDAYNTAVHEVEFEAAAPPGGGVWTVAAINAAEFVWQWNIGGDVTALSLARVEERLLYAGAVEELDRTANVTVVTTAGGNAAEFVVTNTGTDGVYLTKLQIRGRPIFEYDPVVTIAEDADSIEQFGESMESIDMPYQAEIAKGRAIAEYLIYLYGDRDRVEHVSFLANLSEHHMRAALTLDVGDRVGIAEEVTGLFAFTAEGRPHGYHIASTELSIEPGPVVYCTWRLSPADDAVYFTIGESAIGGDDGIAPF